MNNITNIRNECGDITTDPTHIKRVIIKHFKQIDIQNNSINLTTEIKKKSLKKTTPPKLIQKERENLNNAKEIEVIILNLPKNPQKKASDQDGFINKFYQIFAISLT